MSEEKNMFNVVEVLKKIAPYATAALSFGVFVATLRAFLNHEMDSLALLVASQISLLALFFVPQVLAEVRDRQTLSVYREMYIGR